MKTSSMKWVLIKEGNSHQHFFLKCFSNDSKREENGPVGACCSD